MLAVGFLRKSQKALALVLLVGALAACSSGGPRTDPSFAESVPQSGLELYEMFERQCVQQVNLPWARRDLARQVRNYCGIWPDESCLFEVGRRVAWTLDESENGIRVSLHDWVDYDRRRYPANCTISLPEEFGTHIPDFVDRIEESELAVYGPREVAPSSWWNPGNESGKPYVVVNHHSFGDASDEEISAELSSMHPTNRRSAERNLERPWVINYRYPKSCEAMLGDGLGGC